MRAPSVGIAALLIVGLGVAGCSGEQDAPDAPLAFCKAAAEYDFQLTNHAPLAIEKQIRLVRKIADTAPAKIRTDAELFADAIARVQDDPSLKKNKKVRTAVENVNRYAAQGCDFYARQSGI